MAEVFISYQRSRRQLAAYLADIIQTYGVTVWWDHELFGGTKFGPEIEKEIRLAKCTIVLWCSQSINSEWVEDEAKVAKEISTIVPVMLENVKVPMGLRSLHTRDLTQWDCSIAHSAFGQLIRDIEAKLGRSLPPTPGCAVWQRAWEHFGERCFPPLIGSSAETDETSFSKTKKSPRRKQANRSAITAQDLRNRMNTEIPFDEAQVIRDSATEISRRMNDGPFGLLNLCPAVRESVIQAIYDAALARTQAKRARKAKEKARAICSVSKEKTPGVHYTNDETELFCVEVTEKSETGLGVMEGKQGDAAGNTYHGYFLDSEFWGLGIYTWGENGADRVRYEGEHQAQHEFGSALLHYAQGAVYAGRMQGESRVGHGVLSTQYGILVEGEWNGGFEGLGAFWHADGTIDTQGIYEDGKLKTALGPNADPSDNED